MNPIVDSLIKLDDTITVIKATKVYTQRHYRSYIKAFEVKTVKNIPIRCFLLQVVQFHFMDNSTNDLWLIYYTICSCFNSKTTTSSVIDFLQK